MKIANNLQSKTWFLTAFDPCSEIAERIFYCHLSDVKIAGSRPKTNISFPTHLQHTPEPQARTRQPPLNLQWCRNILKQTYSQTSVKQDIFWAIQTGGCLLLHESSAESSCMSFLHYFHSAISNHLSIAISMSPEWTGLTVNNCTDINML